MIEDLRAVPKGVSTRPRELSTASLQQDWEFSLNRESREKAEEAFARASQAYEQVPGSEEEYQERDEDRLRADLETAREDWTEELISWYQIWEEMDVSGIQI